MGWSRFSHIDIFDCDRQTVEQTYINVIIKLFHPEYDPASGDTVTEVELRESKE